MKMYKRNFSSGYIFPLIIMLILVSLYISTFAVIPSKLTLSVGERYPFDFKAPFYLYIKPADKDFIDVSKNNEDSKSIAAPFSIMCVKDGLTRIDISILGILPVKTINVRAVSKKEVVVCGNTIGVKINTRGILVVGSSSVVQKNGKEVNPAREKGIEPGDFIVEADDNKIERISELVDAIDKSGGRHIKIKYIHNNVYSTVDIKPVISADDNKYHIGLWVRDSTAGIGTLTFYEPESYRFGALGHGVTDIDTGAVMPVGRGMILHSSIEGIKRGAQGMPGELKGDFLRDNLVIGILEENCKFGIYGRLYPDKVELINGKTYYVGYRSSVHTGEAKILSNIRGDEVEEFNVKIEKVSRRNFGSKSMLIKITDKKLLDSTGGIVQGMSGSPIIQDDKLIGAVTHVLINDPSKGYGIFIENMLENLK